MGSQKAERLLALPPYLFAEIDRKKKLAIEAGRDIINLGVGDPDQPTPAFIVDELARAARDAKNHQYSFDNGLPAFRLAVVRWYKRRFSVELDPEREVWPLIGSKEGIGHFPLAILNPGDLALVPEPGYPPYRSGSVFAGAEVVPMPLRRENGFLPDLEAINGRTLKRARLMFLNYPNNPTAALATLDFYRNVVEFAKANDVAVASDAAYTEIYFGKPPISFLQVEGAKQVGIEFHSLSKTFNMTGWRIGFAAGNADQITALGQLKSNLDSGIFQAIQHAGVAALDSEPELREGLLRMYRRRRDILVEGLNRLGWGVPLPQATFYVWIPVPRGYTSTQLCEVLLDRTDIVTTPGIGFGPSGEGYIRAALTVEESRLQEAVDRIQGLKL